MYTARGFSAYLAGIETPAATARWAKSCAFSAYLAGIETWIAFKVRPGGYKFSAYLARIETITSLALAIAQYTVFSLPSRD